MRPAGIQQPLNVCRLDRIPLRASHRVELLDQLRQDVKADIGRRAFCACAVPTDQPDDYRLTRTEGKRPAGTGKGRQYTFIAAATQAPSGGAKLFARPLGVKVGHGLDTDDRVRQTDRVAKAIQRHLPRLRHQALASFVLQLGDDALQPDFDQGIKVLTIHAQI